MPEPVESPSKIRSPGRLTTFAAATLAFGGGSGGGGPARNVGALPTWVSAIRWGSICVMSLLHESGG
ncbi:hypothetical protein ACFFOM_10630 [Microlunatus capsulatus]|uniref:Uncharacterized protein n=1 Tax=Microlunatus capsulatus TaxID=99117 RepID=A0ABS4Z9T1_9ACTN|nr:hypothetical protein [Microlunatus capsulatus]MBP2417806.1 hypothetical protein [Microlunatus capsulatus]